MKTKKILALAMALGLSSTLMACGNTEKAAEPVETAETQVEEQANEATTVAEEPATEEATTETPGTTEANPTETAGDVGIYDLQFGYIPEGFVENFNDEKTNLHTIEYVAEKNPAKKIQLQITDDDTRLEELVKVPEDAEDITIGANTGKFWDDGSFRYVVIKDGANNIYARSTLDKDETIKVVEEIK